MCTMVSPGQCPGEWVLSGGTLSKHRLGRKSANNLGSIRLQTETQPREAVYQPIQSISLLCQQSSRAACQSPATEFRFKSGVGELHLDFMQFSRTIDWCYRNLGELFELSQSYCGIVEWAMSGRSTTCGATMSGHKQGSR